VSGQSVLRELLQSRWAGVREGLLATFGKFRGEELPFRPFDEGYSVAELMLHIAHEERIEVHYGLAGLLSDLPAPYATADFPTRESIATLLGRVHAETDAYLSGLDDTELQSETQAGWGDPVLPLDMVWHVIEHETHHRGELSLILGLLGRPGLDA
jgi:uncharacterized damage-inducible protein DinB